MSEVYTNALSPAAGAHAYETGALYDNAFHPTSLPGCVLWLRADLGVTLATSNVTAWKCQASGVTFSQATAAQQPVYSASDATLGNKPSLGCTNAANTLMTTSALTVASSDIVVVAALNETGVTNAQSLIHTALMEISPVEGSPKTGVGYYNSNVASWVTSGNKQTGAQILSWDCRAANSLAIYRNGGAIATGKAWSDLAISGAISVLGRSDAGGFSIDGSVAEIVIVTSPTNQIRRQIERYMGTRYGIAVT